MTYLAGLLAPWTKINYWKYNENAQTPNIMCQVAYYNSTKNYLKQVREQDAYPPYGTGQLKLCATPHHPFQG